MFKEGVLKNISEKKRAIIFLCALFLLYVIRYAVYGFEYYPQLDDYIQYHWYSTMPDTMNSVFLGVGTISTRPLAGILDVYFWTKIFALNSPLLLLLNSLISVLAVYFLVRVLAAMDIKVGMSFYIMLLFLPIVFESQYWLSASSRVMVGVFLSALSLVIFDSYAKRGGKWKLALFWFINLCSMCFYEQVLIFSFLLVVAYMYRTKQKKHMYIFPFVNVLIVAVYYLIFKDVGALGGRTKILLSPEILSHLQYMINELGNIVADCFYTLNVNGIARGFALLWEKFFFLIISLVLAAVVAVFYRKAENKNKKDWFVYLFSAVIIFAPLSILFVTEGAALPYRTVYISLIGAAILIDYLVSLVPANRIVSGICVFAFVFALSGACVSEMADYRKTAIIDKKICQGIAENIDESVITGERGCYLVGAKRAYMQTNALRGEHIISVTSSDWALTGAARYYFGGYVNMITPAEQLTDEILNSGNMVLVLGEDFEVSRIK